MRIASNVYGRYSESEVYAGLLTQPGIIYRNLNNRVTKEFEIENQRVFLKYHKGIGWGEILKNCLRGRAPIVDARNEFLAIKLLEEKNISVPKIVGFAQKGINPAKRQSFILLEAIDYDKSLEDVLLCWEINPPSCKEKWQLIEKTSVMVRGMHQAGVFHRDLYLCHFLLGDRGKLTLIDFHRARCFSKLPSRYRRKDLAALYFSSLLGCLTERDFLRFIRSYYGCSLKEIPPHTWRFLRSVQKRAFSLYKKVYGFGPKEKRSEIEQHLYPGALLSLDTGHSLEITETLRLHPQKRMVVRGKIDAHPVVAKIYFHPMKRHLHIMREVSGSKHLLENGILTPSILFQAFARSIPASVLIYDEVQDVLPKFEFKTYEEQKDQLLAFVDVIASHHRVGIVQKDLHVGNFLRAGGRIYTLDGDQVYKLSTSVLDIRRAFDNFSLFLAQFSTLNTQGRDDLIHHYLKQMPGFPKAKNTIDGIAKLTQEKLYKRGRDFLEKIYRNCTQFCVANHFKSFRVVPREFYTPTLIHALGDLDSVISKPSVHLYKNGNTCTVAKVNIQGVSYAIKRYNIKNLKHFMMRFWRPTRAWRSWYGAYLFHFFGIPTVKPIALLEKRTGKIRKKAYFITDLVEGEPLEAYFLNPTHTDAQKREMAKNAIDILRRLFQLQIKHGDMKMTNFIVRDGVLHLIDLDSVTWFRCGWWYRQSVKGDWKRFFANWKNKPQINQYFEGLSIW